MGLVLISVLTLMGETCFFHLLVRWMRWLMKWLATLIVNNNAIMVFWLWVFPAPPPPCSCTHITAEWRQTKNSETAAVDVGKSRDRATYPTRHIGVFWWSLSTHIKRQIALGRAERVQLTYPNICFLLFLRRSCCRQKVFSFICFLVLLTHHLAAAMRVVGRQSSARKTRPQTRF